MKVKGMKQGKAAIATLFGSMGDFQDESSIVADMSSLSLTQWEPRRSGRLAQNRVMLASLLSHQGGIGRLPSQGIPDLEQTSSLGGKVPAFIIEYKAPHKVPLAHIKARLQDMDLDEVIRLQKDESPEIICRRALAAVITQSFSYMIHGGLEYGYVCTGEAFIFLRVLHDDPSTVYYYLSVPEEDVGQRTGWAIRTVMIGCI